MSVVSFPSPRVSEGEGRVRGLASPETRLRALFRKEAQLERQLLETRQAIQGERKRYAEKHRLGCFPGVEQLRRLFR